MRSLRLACVAIGVVVGFAGAASADPIRVDQTALEPFTGGGVAIGLHRPDTTCCDLATQVFTAGVTAPLVAISVAIAATHVTPLRLAITPMLETADPFGVPDLSTVLAEVLVPNGSAPINDILFWLDRFYRWRENVMQSSRATRMRRRHPRPLPGTAYGSGLTPMRTRAASRSRTAATAAGSGNSGRTRDSRRGYRRRQNLAR
jgi:hypothetical protein